MHKTVNLRINILALINLKSYNLIIYCYEVNRLR